MKITVKELATELGISIDAVHKQIKRNPDIEEYIERQGRRILIDEVGQDIIRQKSIGTPNCLLTDQTVLDELNEYRKKYEKQLELNQELLIKLHQQNELIGAASANKLLLEERTMQLDDKSIENEKLLKENQRLSEIAAENEKLKEELAAEKSKSWWQKLTKG